MNPPTAGRASVLVGGAALPAGDQVYHRLASPDPAMVTTDLASGARRASSGAFKPDADGVSAYSRTAMEAAGVQVGHLLVKEGNLLIRLDVDEIRTLEGLNVVGDPWPADLAEPEASHPRNAAHSLIVGLAESKNVRIRLQRKLAKMSSMALLEPPFDPALAYVTPPTSAS